MKISPPHRVGRYELERELGLGAMGQVFLARDTVIDRLVVLKTLRRSSSAEDDESQRQQLIAEAKSAGKLSHPNLVTVYDVLENGDQLFLAMEYVEGRTLAELLEEEGCLTAGEALSLTEQVCAGLSYLHRAGIVHRDIKPANILVSVTGAIKIADFGIALLDQPPVGRRETAGDKPERRVSTTMGTPEFMAPEQLLGHNLDGRADLFSFGSVLYEALSGRSAFGGGSISEIGERILEAPPPPLDEEALALPQGVADVVSRCLAAEPADRFPRAEAIVEELRRVVEPAAPETAPDSLDQYPVLKRLGVRRRRTLLWGMALALTAGVSIGLVLMMRITPENGEPASQSLPRGVAELKLLQEGVRLSEEGDAAGAAVLFELVERLAEGQSTLDGVGRRALKLREEADEKLLAEAVAASAPPEIPVLQGDRAGLVDRARKVLSTDRRAREETLTVLDKVESSLSQVPANLAQLEVDFFSERPKGTVMIYAGEEQILRQAFSYHTRRAVFLRKPSTGGFEEIVDLQPGETELRIYVAVPKSGSQMVPIHSDLKAGQSRRLEIYLPAEGEARVALR